MTITGRFTPASDAHGPATDYASGFVLHGVVKPEDIDVLGHVNNAVYVGWVQDAAILHWNARATAQMVEDYVWVCLRHEIDYRTPLFDGEPIEMRTWLGERRGARFNRHVDIRKAGARTESVRAKTTWAMLNKATGRPARIQDEVVRLFSPDSVSDM